MVVAGSINVILGIGERRKQLTPAFPPPPHLHKITYRFYIQSLYFIFKQILYLFLKKVGNPFPWHFLSDDAYSPHSMAHSFGESYRVDSASGYLAVKVFCAWDYKVIQKHCVQLQSENICTHLKASVERLEGDSGLGNQIKLGGRPTPLWMVQCLLGLNFQRRGPLSPLPIQQKKGMESDNVFHSTLKRSGWACHRVDTGPNSADVCAITLNTLVIALNWLYTDSLPIPLYFWMLVIFFSTLEGPVFVPS